MIDQDLWNQMSDGQKQLISLGAQQERARISALVKELVQGCPTSSNELFILTGLLKEINDGA